MGPAPYRDEVQFQVALPGEQYREVDARAKMTQRPLNDEIIFLLTHALLREERRQEAERKAREWGAEAERGSGGE